MNTPYTLIERDPQIMHGKPIFVGTRITVSTILEMLAAKHPIEDILSDYPTLTRQHIYEALAYASSLLQEQLEYV